MCSSWWRSSARLQWRTWMKSSTTLMGHTDCWSSWWVSHMDVKSTMSWGTPHWGVRSTRSLWQVAVCVVCYGVSETVFGEWSVMGSTIILVHSYYNVWLRAQLGWQSFLLRRDAVNKIKSLPTASSAQLEQYNDICAICYQVGAT